MRIRKAPSGPLADLVSFPGAVNNTPVAGVVTIDWSLGPNQRLLLDQSCTVTSIGLHPTETAELTLLITQASGGSHSVAFIGGKIQSGYATSTANGATDLLDLLSLNGSLWISVRGLAYA